MPELKQCPFCGGEAIVERDSFSGSFYVGCLNDECLGFSGLGWTYKKEEEAIEAWNKRHERTCHFDQTDEIPTISGMIRVWECSNCGRECEELNGVYEYCPHCKAKVIQDAN